MKQVRVMTNKFKSQIKHTTFKETFELITSTLVCLSHSKIKLKQTCHLAKTVKAV